MSKFSITSTASCEFCGNMLSSSDESCGECSTEDVLEHVFRLVPSGNTEKDTVMVQATMRYKWNRLEKVVGDDWIRYEYLGPRSSVSSMCKLSAFDTIEDIPCRAASFRAPAGVGE